MKLKEFLSVRGIGFQSVNIAESPEGLDELRRLGIRTIPVVTRGDAFVFGQSLKDVAAFLGIAMEARQELPAAEIARRMDTILAAAERFVRQMPDELLVHKVPNRDRTYRVLTHHIFRIPESFIEVADDGTLLAESLVAPPPDDMRSVAQIADYGADVRRRVAAWWASDPSRPDDRPVSTYFGSHPLREVMERTAWHSGQHVRQLMAILEMEGIRPERPLGPADFDGLPLPEKVWDE
ncbi:MAG: DinB family protein [Alphaproteobacteria bacterium]